VAVNDNATLVINAGNYLTAAVDTPLPADLSAPGVDWTNVGHTSLEDIFGITSEGGEATVLGTLQSKSLRTTYSTRSETMTFTLQQFDADALKLYFGSNMIDIDGAGTGTALGVPTNPTPTVRAFLAIFIDGENKFAFYAPKAELFRGDDMELSDTESLAGLPITVKPMVSGSNEWTYAVTPLGAA
jgi:sugar/nucleoside kinase (ribokinase family)